MLWRQIRRRYPLFTTVVILQNKPFINKLDEYKGDEYISYICEKLRIENCISLCEITLLTVEYLWND